MNPLYNQLFNPQYANQDYLQHLHWQQHDTEQRQEIMNAVKAIHDYFDSARKIAPEYQQMAFDACITAVVTEYSARDCAARPLKLSIHSGGIEHACRRR